LKKKKRVTGASTPDSTLILPNLNQNNTGDIGVGIADGQKPTLRLSEWLIL
jgi:hypothetical protein